MDIHTGIVLKHYVPKKNKLALLDKTLGRITAVAVCEALSAGTVLAYHMQMKRHWYILTDIELVDMPLFLARHDMLFLHHMLEICYYFIPEGSGPSRIYDFLLFVYKKRIRTNEQKKKMLGVLFALLDVYPDNDPLYCSYMHALAQESLEAIIDRKMDVNIEKYISGWLYQCIQMHTDAQKFKTIHFLDEIR